MNVFIEHAAPQRDAAPGVATGPQAATDEIAVVGGISFRVIMRPVPANSAA